MHRLVRLVVVMVSAIALLALMPGAQTASAQEPESPFFVVRDQLPFEALPGFEDATQHWGIHRQAGFRVEVPADWNGELVMWAHGFRGEGPELTVDSPPIREFLLANGYAWGASSYTENGYNVLSGTQSTSALARMTANRFLPERPERTYIAGASMGGHITALSTETYPMLYDGAMPVCGVVGDYHLFDFFLDYNLVAQHLGTGSAQFPVDPVTYFGSTVPTIIENLEAAPGTWPAVNETGQQLKDFTELASGGDRPNFEEAWAFWSSGDVPFLFTLGVGDGTLPNSDGKSVLGNQKRRYQLDLDPALSAAEEALNAELPRIPTDYSARSAERISGNLPVPTMSLHNLGDLFVPWEMEIRYAEDVAEAGKSDLLVQRAIRGVGHCDFTQFELESGFADLVTWVETGARPAGDIVLDPAAVAADDYGCAFSDPDYTLHTFATPCN